MGQWKKPLIIALVVGSVVVFAGVWEGLAWRAKGDFLDSLEAGEIRLMPRELRDKEWSKAELRAAVPKKLDANYVRALSMAMHHRGAYTVAAHEYAYQVRLTDADTGIRYYFGQGRRSKGWAFVRAHPDDIPRATAIRRALVQEELRQEFPTLGLE